jgi:hypothetical protein
MVRSKGLFGIVDETGREIVAPRFEGLALSQDGLAIFDLDGKMGAIDRDGKVVIEPKQAYLGRLGKTRFALADAREAIAISGSKWTKNGGITFFGSFRTAEFLRSKIRIEEHNRQLEIFPKGSLRIVDLRAGDQDHIRFDALFSPTSSSEHATILAAKTVAGWGILGADGSWLTDGVS